MSQIVNNTVIIGIDTGYGMVKTSSKIFPTCIKENKDVKPAFSDGVIKYKGQYYSIGGDNRVPVKVDKTVDDIEYILALAAIAEELKLLGRTSANVYLSVGLPLTRCSGETRVNFQNYYLREKNVHFEYEDKVYDIVIEGCMVNAQCITGILSNLFSEKFKIPSVVVDIGSWTVDIIPVENNKPVYADAVTINEGVLKCITNCNDLINVKYGTPVKESQIQAVMRGMSSGLSKDIEALVKSEIRNHCQLISNKLLEHNINVKMMPCFITGGGSVIVENFGREFFPDATIDTNIFFNAQGYEAIAKRYLTSKSA